MKYSCIVLLLVTSFAVSQTYDLNNCGLDNNPLLNSDESKLLNYHFARSDSVEGRTRTFDFTNKKVAFIIGPIGKHVSTKVSFFSQVKSNIQWQINGSDFDILNQNEKIASGGYDVIITSWVKLKLDKNEMIEKLTESKKKS